MRWLMDTVSFVTRDRCGVGWTGNHIAINRVANFLIFLSYFTIPLSLFFLWLEVKKLQRFNRIIKALHDVIRDNTWVLLMFCSFILLCGMTHLNNVMVFEWAPYRFYTLIEIMTATTSVATAIMLPGVVRKIVVALSEEDCDASPEEAP